MLLRLVLFLEDRLRHLTVNVAGSVLNRRSYHDKTDPQSSKVRGSEDWRGCCGMLEGLRTT